MRDSRCTGVILAGGQASRYGGRPKGLARVAGIRIIDRVAEVLASVTDDLLLIANDPDSGSWLPDVRREFDVRPAVGSLGGIHAALVHARGPALVVAWDMPFVPPALLLELLAAGATADAAVPESGSRRGLEPLCGFYTPICVPAIERRLDADDRRVIGFFDDVHVARVSYDVVARHGDPAMIFMNVNTPEDLGLAEAYATTANGRGDRP